MANIWNDYQDAKRHLVCLLQYIGEDPLREGLIDTPERILRSWKELFSGYQANPDDILTCFEDGACNEMIAIRGIEFFSTCEHHFLPFFGTVDIGYIPNGRVIGLSKPARLVEIFSRRLQIQERLTTQIADALVEYLQPKGVMVVVKAKHFCMTCRGVKQPNSTAVTSAIRGVFQDLDARTEFMRLTQ